MPTTTERTREQRLRDRAKRRGYLIRKSRVQTPNIDDHGGYMLVALHSNLIEAGARFDLDLDDVERFLAD